MILDATPEELAEAAVAPIVIVEVDSITENTSLRTLALVGKDDSVKALLSVDNKRGIIAVEASE